MKIYLSLLSFIICLNSFQVFGVTGPATTYKITMKKIELCTAAPLADEHDTTCTGAVVVGTGDTTFDISSVTAGADVGNFVSTAGLPIGTKFTHAKPTMNREFTIKGYAEADSNCFCRTESDSTYGSVNKYYALQWGVCEANATDAANNRLGINTTTPTKALTVTGDISGSGDLNVNGNITGSSVSASIGKFTTVDIDGGTAVFSGGTITGNLSVGGTLTAQEVHTEFESASVLFTSGSTRFGNDTTDVHRVTGSMDISGSLKIPHGDVTVTDTLTATNFTLDAANRTISLGSSNNIIVADADSSNLA